MELCCLLIGRTSGSSSIISSSTSSLWWVLKFHIWDNTTIELNAMSSFSHIIQPWMYEYKCIIIEGNNKTMVEFIHSSMIASKWQTRPKAAPDYHFLAPFYQVIFSHVRREHNKVADFCAKLATQADFSFLNCTDTQTIP